MQWKENLINPFAVRIILLKWIHVQWNRIILTKLEIKGNFGINNMIIIIRYFWCTQICQILFLSMNALRRVSTWTHYSICINCSLVFFPCCKRNLATLKEMGDVFLERKLVLSFTIFNSLHSCARIHWMIWFLSQIVDMTCLQIE